MSEGLSHWPNEVAHSQDIRATELTKELQTLGVSVTQDFLNTPEIQKGLAWDIIAVRNNPAERWELEYSALNDSVQAATGEQKYAVIAGIQDPEDRKRAIRWLGDEREAYYDWQEAQSQKRQAVIDQRDLRMESFLGINERLKDIDSKLTVLNTEASQIFGDAAPDIQDLRANTEQIPELQWVDPQAIQRGDFDQILLSHYFLSLPAEAVIELLADKPESERERFGALRLGMSDILGRPRSIEPTTEAYQNFTDGLVLGTNRDRIVEAGKSTIASGEYTQSIVYDPHKREITFEWKKGTNKVLELDHDIPRERISRDGLSISRDIPAISPAEKRTQELRGEQTILTEALQEQSNHPEMFLHAQSQHEIASIQKFSSANTAIMETYTQAYGEYYSSQTPEESLMALKKLWDQNEAIKTAIWNNPIDGEMTSEDMTLLATRAEREGEYLRKLERTISEFIAVNEELNTLPPPQWDSFEKSASTNLDLLVESQYHHLGQEILARIIPAINRKKNVEASGENYIDPSLNKPMTLRAQYELTRAIDRLVGRRDKPLPETGTENDIARIQVDLAKTPEDTWENLRERFDDSGDLRTLPQIIQALYNEST